MNRFIPAAAIGTLMIASLAADGAAAQSCVGNRNMCDALMYLEQARNSLIRADSNKGGYRRDAMQSVDRAMRQVRLGIQHSSPVLPR